MDTSRRLRVALIHGGRIIEDRTLPKHGRVTVGQATSNTFVVPFADVPESTTVLDYRDGRYTLRFPEGSEGRLAVGGAERTLSQLATQGLAAERHGAHELPLDASSRGRVAVGEVSLLFQFVTPPPPVPVPELPGGVRGVWGQMDRFFFAVLAVSLAAHFAGAGFIAAQPMPRQPELALDELPLDRFLKQPVRVPEKPQATEVATTEPAPTATPSAPATPPRHTPPVGDLRAHVRTTGLLAVIGSKGDGRGLVEDLLHDSKGVADVRAALKDASGVKVATVGEVRRRGAETGDATTIDEPRTDGTRIVALDERPLGEVRDVRGTVKDEPLQVPSKEIDREKLAGFVRARKGALQACYERELKRNPSLQGRIVIHFSVTPRGRASEIGFEENTLRNDGVTGCIQALMSSWAFPFRPSDDIPVEYPFVFTPTSR